MEKKAPIKLNKKTLFTSVFAVLGALVLGAGMCLCLVWESFILGTVIGVVGIVMLLSLIPIIKGLK
jgi:ABC-type amino acid transport system permease subunit